MSTHTPGPWKWNNGNLIGAYGEIIAEKNDDGTPDARLIAAPELLEAFEDAIDALNFDGRFTAKEILKTVEMVRCNMRQAIAKAEGKI